MGRNLSFANSTDVEIENRISTAWKKFGIWKEELTCKSYPLPHRLRLFDSTVTPTVLYGSCTWTMTASKMKRLQTTQRRMLRLMIGHERRRIGDSDFALETWVDWVQRATRKAEDILQNLGYSDWNKLQREAKLNWANRLEEMEHDRWARLAYDWRPDLFETTCRRQGRPKRRGGDDITNNKLGVII